MKLLYSRDDMLLIKQKMLNTIETPEELKLHDFKIINLGFPETSGTWKQNSKRNHRRNSGPPLPSIKRYICLKGVIPFDDKILDIIYRYFRTQPPDTKEVRSLLNKLTFKNEKEIIEKIGFLNYTSPDIVEMIFKKAVTEPFFSEVYARLCVKLKELRPLIQEMCTDQFKLNKSKNLCNFIGELYRKKILISIHGIINELTIDNLELNPTETNIDILCELITVVGPKRGVFDNSFVFLNEQKNKIKWLSKRHQFKILDVEDYRSGKRKIPVKKAKNK